MSYYSQDENRSAAARIALKQDSNRRFITVIIILLVVILLGIMIYLYIKVLAGVKRSNSNTTSTTTTTVGGVVLTNCTSDSQCPISNPKCDTATKTCVSCLNNNDCTGNVTVCDTTKKVCVECIDNSTCIAPTTCKLAIGQCGFTITAPNPITNAVITSNGGQNCTDYNLTGSWNQVAGAASYDVQVNGFNTNPGQTGPVSIRALGLTTNSISGNIVTVFNDAPQDYPTVWCGGTLTIQVRAHFFNGAISNYTDPRSIGGSTVCC